MQFSYGRRIARILPISLHIYRQADDKALMGGGRKVQRDRDLTAAGLALLPLILEFLVVVWGGRETLRQQLLLEVVELGLTPDLINSRHQISSVRLGSQRNLVSLDRTAAESFQAGPLRSDYILLWSSKLSRFTKFVGF